MQKLEELSKEQLIAIILEQVKRIQEMEKRLALLTNPHIPFLQENIWFA